ncbi:GtrA family protein [Flavisphingomonas formosensis]|uniref:GtrA family protein n=1 Tax=Flavisphingomonas formosensis TaxID=861534 RepID=UPI0012FABC4C|nr:GtrA family protein [Sphingomonas formosensis]
MIARLRGVRAPRYMRYVLASGGALALDFVLLSGLIALGVGAVPASAIGYAAGILAHWALSSRTVFADAVARHGPARRRQQAMFVLSALVGLLITTAIVGSGAAFGLDPRVAKIVAIAISFQATWLIRRHIVFV